MRLLEVCRAFFSYLLGSSFDFFMKILISFELNISLLILLLLLLVSRRLTKKFFVMLSLLLRNTKRSYGVLRFFLLLLRKQWKKYTLTGMKTTKENFISFLWKWFSFNFQLLFISALVFGYEEYKEIHFEKEKRSDEENLHLKSTKNCNKFNSMIYIFTWWETAGKSFWRKIRRQVFPY